MGTSSVAFTSAMFTQTGGIIKDLIPLFYLALAIVIALFVAGIVRAVMIKGFKNLFK